MSNWTMTQLQNIKECIALVDFLPKHGMVKKLNEIYKTQTSAKTTKLNTIKIVLNIQIQHKA